MTARTRRISAVLACAVLLTGCSSLLGDRTPHDDRFAEFTQVLADENKNLEIQTDAERLTRRSALRSREGRAAFTRAKRTSSPRVGCAVNASSSPSRIAPTGFTP